jgi:hypothetical protein
MVYLLLFLLVVRLWLIQVLYKVLSIRFMPYSRTQTTLSLKTAFHMGSGWSLLAFYLKFQTREKLGLPSQTVELFLVLIIFPTI